MRHAATGARPAPRAGGTAAGAYGSSQEVKDLLGGLFHYVAVEPPPEDEQRRILAGLHPQLAPLLPHAMDTLALVRAAYGQAPHGRALGEAVVAALAAAGIGAGGGCSGAFGFSVGRHFSIRDVLKWCRRMGRVSAPRLRRLPALPPDQRSPGRPAGARTRALLASPLTLPHPTPASTPALAAPAAARRAAAALAQAQQGGAVPRLGGVRAGGAARGGLCGGRRLLLRAAGPRRGEQRLSDGRGGRSAGGPQRLRPLPRSSLGRKGTRPLPCPAMQAGERLLAALAALWAVPAEAVQQYAALHKPAVQAGSADLAVGRATLPLLDAAAGRAALAAAAGGGAKVGPRVQGLRRGRMASMLCTPCLSLPGFRAARAGLARARPRQVLRGVPAQEMRAPVLHCCRCKRPCPFAPAGRLPLCPHRPCAS